MSRDSCPGQTGKQGVPVGGTARAESLRGVGEHGTYDLRVNRKAEAQPPGWGGCLGQTVESQVAAR